MVSYSNLFNSWYNMDHSFHEHFQTQTAEHPAKMKASFQFGCNCTCSCVHVFMCTCVHVYMCSCVHVYTRTNIFCDTHLQKTYKTFSSSRSWSQIQILPQQWRASLVQTSCQELPGFLISSESVTRCFEMLHLDVFGTEFVVGGVVVASSVTNFHHLKFLHVIKIF